eukprot:GDKI01035364.1.p1 GENE.GDKI01035364.1~~GDKI01035364.1.p1  ORF type:complete len:178 (+),score=40.56 GDKI01035364.1:443-976(+)
MQPQDMQPHAHTHPPCRVWSCSSHTRMNQQCEGASSVSGAMLTALQQQQVWDATLSKWGAPGNPAMKKQHCHLTQHTHMINTCQRHGATIDTRGIPYECKDKVHRLLGLAGLVGEGLLAFECISNRGTAAVLYGAETAVKMNTKQLNNSNMYKKSKISDPVSAVACLSALSSNKNLQ